MKLSLAIKIIIKDYFPKWKSIPYENFVCLINCDNNLISQLRFSELSENNYINHKIDNFNSNVIYNFHILDVFKKSLIGVCHLNINFDKLKNLNINDTLTQEGHYKLIIDSNTKRKFFNNITNMGDIYLIIATEIKILNRKLYILNKFKNSMISFKNENINLSNIKNANNTTLNLLPKSSKQKRIIRKMKNDHEYLNILDTISGKSEIYSNTQTRILDENEYNTFYQSNILKKNKSINKAKVNIKNIIKSNNNIEKNILFNFNNSCSELLSPKYCNTNYSKEKNNKKKNRITLNKNKVSILNLLEQKVDKSKFKQDFNNIIESNKLTDNIYNFSKTQMGKNFGRKDYNTFNSFNKLSCEQKDKKCGKSPVESNNFKKKNKIQINILGKNDISTERKLNSRKNLNLIDYSRINTEIINNNNFISHNKNLSLNNNINNIFLQTEASTSTVQKLPHNKISINKNFLKNLNIKQIITDKDKFRNKILIEQTRGTFSPKLSSKNNFEEGIMLTEANDRIQSRNKSRLNKKMMTPKGNKIKYITLNFSKDKNKGIINEDLRKKFIGIMDCYSLLMKRIKFNFENNEQFAKKFKEIKERYNNLNKCKNMIANMKNVNESKKVINHTLFHFEEEKLISNLINIKLKENSINEIIFGGIEKNETTINKINVLISKKEDTLLNLTKNIVKYYGNISEIYNKDNDKKIKLIKILEKYGIKEKNKTNFNYINYMNKTNQFNDKVITEVDEEKENEEELEESNKKNNNLILDDEILFDNNINITSEKEKNNIQEIKITIPNLYNHDKNKDEVESHFDNEINYDENLNDLISTILIEQFPKKYKAEEKFIYLEKNKYMFKDKFFFAFIENNDVILKEENNNKKYTLDNFYNNFCYEDRKNNSCNFIYTKKIRQKYIKIKGYEEKETNTDKKIKNENSTTMDTDFIQQSMISKGNEMSEEKI